MIQQIKCLINGHQYYVTKDRISTVTLRCKNCNQKEWLYKQESNVTPETYHMGNTINEKEQEQEQEQERECE
jgi:hypothetical protein